MCAAPVVSDWALEKGAGGERGRTATDQARALRGGRVGPDARARVVVEALDELRVVASQGARADAMGMEGEGRGADGCEREEASEAGCEVRQSAEKSARLHTRESEKTHVPPALPRPLARDAPSSSTVRVVLAHAPVLDRTQLLDVALALAVTVLARRAKLCRLVASETSRRVQPGREASVL